ncbi:MAG: alanine racemase [Chloroflexi bacterium]|nr:alanine racemase [Chloroflexota bacterium]
MASEGQQGNGRRGRPLWAEIDLDALAHNVRALKSLAGGAELAAVVKANAYGHGAVGAGRAALEAGADRLAVICVEEGEQLRQAGIEAPILVMGYTPLGEERRIIELRLTPTVNSRDQAEALAAAAVEAGVVQAVHVKVDTGLNRFGLRPPEAIALAGWIRDVPSLQLEGLFTHFANADEGDKSYTLEQYRAFTQTAERLPWVPLRHVSNTANLLDMPEMSLDLVRPGIGIFGCYPAGNRRSSAELRPVLSLRSRIVRLSPLPAGETVSYGRTWRAERPSLIGLVTCGYGDGLPRVLSNRGSLLVRGRRVPIVGRVCMDMSMADVTDVPEVAEGDEVTIIGRDGEGQITAEEIGELCGTISYEILCGIAARVPRLFLRQGQVIGAETLVHKPAEEASVQAW